MLDTRYLYKRVDHNWFVRYDARTDTYDTVPASSVRHVQPVAGRRVRLSASAGRAEDRADPHADFRRAVALSMLDFQERAHAAGDPQAATPYLKALAQLAANPEAISKLRLGWWRAPSEHSKYGFIAVGYGEHAGQKKYGQDAMRVLANQPRRDQKKQSQDRARKLLDQIRLSDSPQHEHLTELATHLPALSVEQLRTARVYLDATWGGQRLRKSGMIDRLQDHIRGTVDAMMAAQGVEAVNPEPEPDTKPAGQGEPDLATQVFNDPDHPLNDVLRQTFGTDQGTGQKVYSPTKAQLRGHLDQLAKAGALVRPEGNAPAPQPAPAPAPAAPQPSEPESVDYSKFDAIMRTAGDRAKAEQIARVTGVPVRPEGQPADSGETDLAPHGITDASSRDDVIAAAARIAPELGEKVRRLPKAKQLAAIREHLKSAPKPAEPAPAPAAQEPATPQPTPAQQQPEPAKADAVHPAVEKYAQAMLQQQLDRFKDFPPEQQERLRQKGALSDENLQKFLEEQRTVARERMGSFGDKEEVWKHLKRGTFHPTNKHSRAMFEAATGVKLPSTAGGTKEAVRKYLGDEFVNGKEEEAARAEQQAADAERQKKEAAAKTADERYNGFGAELNARDRARVRGQLDKVVTAYGTKNTEAEVREHVEQMVNDGWTYHESRNGGYLKQPNKGNGSFIFSAADYGKIPLQYAQHLLAQKRNAESPDPESTPLTESLFKPGGTLAGKPREPLPPHLRDGQPPEADELPPAPPGKLFDAGDNPRPEQVQAVDAIADMARRRLPGVEIDDPGANAPLTEHLNALAAIDRHARGLGVRSTFFGDLADLAEQQLADFKSGKIDADDLRETADDIGNGYLSDHILTGRHGRYELGEIADELRDKGHEDAARFFERQAERVQQIVKGMLNDAAGPEPSDKEPHEMTGEEYTLHTPLPAPVRNAKGTSRFTRAEAQKYLDENKSDDVDHIVYEDRDHNNRKTGGFNIHPRPSHKKIVKDALARGERVPPEVLKQYPDLTAEPEPAAQNIDNANTSDKVTDGRAAEPRAPGEGAGNVVLEEASRGTGAGGDSGRERVGAPVRDFGAQRPAGTGEADGSGVPVLRPGAGGGSGEGVQRADGAGDRPGDGAGDRSARPAQPRLKRKSEGPPRDPETGARLGGGVDGTEPALPNPTPHEAVVSEPPAPDNPTDVSAGNFRYTDREFFKGGQKAKYNANLAAIRVLKQIKDEGRDTATPEEQAILSKFTGWGQFPALFNDFYDPKFRAEMENRGVSWGEFDTERRKWDAEREVLQGLLSPEEWAAAGRSTLNAHYTHPDVVDTHWKIAQQLGFKGGRYLETSAGVGYYLGLMPPELAARTRTSAIELDPTTAGILKLLYPAANVMAKGFQEHQIDDGFYDFIASNVPFGNYKVHDPRYNRHQANIHDYFFLKSLDKVRPGGLVMHITSTGTLDKPDSAIRKHLAEQGDLVGAIRFPGDAHKENAGTSVVTDMLIFRKRMPGEQPGDRSWLETTTVPDPAGGEPIPVNKYFAQNPHMVLGTIDRTGSLYQGNSANVSKTDDYEDRLAKAVAALPSNVMTPARAPKDRFAPDTLPAPGDVKNGGYKVKDGKVYVRKGDQLVQQDHDTKGAEKVAAHLEVLGAVRALLRKETVGEDVTKERATLNTVYDAFVKQHGPINLPANKKAFAAPDDAPVLHALENYDPKAKKATKTDIFTKPVVAPVPRVDRAGSVAEGLGVSLHETGGLDVKRIAELTGKDERAVGRELLENGLAYEDPSHGWQPADQYLSGNVRQKLLMARAAAAADPRYAPNVAALEKVQPADLHHDEISANLGAAWIPPSDIQQFASELLNGRKGAVKVTKVARTGDWHVDWNDDYARRSTAAQQTWGVKDEGGTTKVDFADILKAALTGAPLTVRVYDPARETNVTHPELTEAANVKVQQLRDEFKNWIWVDQERRERLHRYYNDNFNNIRPINYDGSHLKFPGMTPNFKLRPHQKNFVWQVVSTGKGLAAHEVGTGKTASMIAAAMELRRLGLAKKPCIAALKANAEAIAEDARRLYPGARILSLANLTDAKKRKEAMSRVATGDYDIVIMTHPQLDKLGMRKKTQEKYLREEIGELEAAHAAAMAEDPKGRAGKELKKAKENLEARLQAAMKAEEKDDAVNFEDLGIDQLFVDEAHAYKTLPAYSKRRGLKGINNGRSDRATNMLMRTRWLMENNGGRGVVFATGTPITNTVGELYVMQKYLQPEELEARGITNFDSWAATFAEQESKQEKTGTGEFKDVTRLAKYNNVPELKAIAGQMLDNQRVDDLKDRFPFPDEAAARKHAAALYAKNPYTDGKANPTDEDLKAVGMEVTKTPGGGYEVASPIVSRPRRKDILHTLPPVEMTQRMMKELQQRARDIKGKKPGEGGDNMLTICTDGRKGAIDARMLYGDAPDDPDSKANKLVEQVLKINKEHPGKTQMIFSNLGVHPAKEKKPELEFADGDEAVPSDAPDVDAGSRTGFHLYGDIIDKLVEGGIPRDKIADFSKLEGDAKKQAVAKLRTGEMLVAIGSTEKLGTGVNAQHKLIAMHHLDVPWKPADLEQRDGRGWRNGNENKEVQVHKYVTERSLDDYFWGTLSRKDKMIKQMLSRKGGAARDMVEEDTEEMTPDQIMAAASGDPRILEKVQTEDDIRKLQNAAKRHEREQYEYQRGLRVAESKRGDIQRKIDGYEQTIKHLEARPDFELKVRGGETFTSRKEGGLDAANEALAAAFEKAGNGFTVGEYRGLRLLKDSNNLYLLTPNNARLQVRATVGSIEASSRGFDNMLYSAQAELEQHEKDTATLRANAGKPFPKADELKQKIERQKQLEKALREEQEAEEKRAREAASGAP